MKIIYAIKNNTDSEIQLKYFLQNYKHEILTVGENESLNIKFNYIIENKSIAPIFIKEIKEKISKEFKLENFPIYKFEDYQKLINIIEAFKPNLIISDQFKLLSFLAKHFKITLWHVSSSFIINGINWWKKFWEENTELRRIYYDKFVKRSIQADRTFICSPFGHLYFPLNIKDNFEWVTPYFTTQQTQSEFYDLAGTISDAQRHDVLSKIFDSLLLNSKLFSNAEDCKYYLNSRHFLSEGDVFTLTSYLFNCKNQNIILSPGLKNIEHRVNANLCQLYKIGFNVSFIESFTYDAPEILLESLEKKNDIYQYFDLEKYPIKHLHQIIEEQFTERKS